jgi:hypothetical protein
MDNGKSTFKHWCIVELFGHSKIAGHCTEENIAGTNMLRVDVPETKLQPAFTKFYGSSAIYAINPCDEQTAMIAAENLKIGQVVEWNAKTFIDKFNSSKALPAPADIMKENRTFEDEEDDFDEQF